MAAVDAWDRRLMARVGAPTGPLRWLALGVTAFGSAVITLPLELLGWLLAAPPLAPAAGLCLLADVPGHLVLIVPFRFGFRRPRPTPFAKPPLGFDVWNLYSFPSAHSLRVWTLAVILSRAFPGWWPVLVGLAAIITATRIFLRRHFPSDILVGGVLGLLWGLLLTTLLPGGIPRPF